jgi:phage tail-like protein
MPIGQAQQPLMKQMFLVDIDGIPSTPLAFSKAGPFKTTRGEATYRPGGQRVSEKRNNSVNYENITLERAASTDDSLNEWYENHLRGDDPRSMTVTQLDDEGNPAVVYRVEEARPVEYQPAELDGDSEDIDIEILVVSCRSWEREVR